MPAALCRLHRAENGSTVLEAQIQEIRLFMLGIESDQREPVAGQDQTA